MGRYLWEGDLRVLVISANPLARGGMEALVESMPGARLMASVGPAESAPLVAQLMPDILLLDTGPGELVDLEPIGRLAEAYPGLPIVALGASQQALLTAVALGASTLLAPGTDAGTLRTAMEAACKGLSAFPRGVLLGLLPPDEPEGPSPGGPVESLTPRELEVLRGMARGFTNRQIARQLVISEHTVKFHAASVLGKLGARSRTEAVARAIGMGLILV